MGNTILLADKSVTIQKIVQLTFADEDFKIVCVNDGQSALETISQVHPDIILADIGLPVKNGYDLCTALRKDPAFGPFAGTPVILLAGIYETMDEERAKQVEQKVKEVGANAMLSKPFDPQLLTARVKELISQSAPPAAPATPAAPSPDMFADMVPPSEAGFFDESATPVSEPFDAPPDNEKTMMLPGPPGFAVNMFAEGPPALEEEAPAPSQAPAPPVDVDAVKPVDEMVFDEGEMESMPQVEEPVPEPAPAMAPPMKDQSPAFPGFEEAAIEPPVEEEAFATAPVPVVPEEKPVIASDQEDPFGDVFAQSAPAPAAWSASEEENPFGAPEPPPPPPAPPAPEPEPELGLETSASAVEEAFNAPELEEPAPSMDESDREQVEEMMEAHAAPDFGEDTWSRARAAAEQEQPVEELFETAEAEEQPPAYEETVELQPDITSPGIKVPEMVMAPEPAPIPEPEPETQPPQPVPAPGVAAVPPGQMMDISDEAVERIARRVVELLSDRVVSEIVWQVVPDLAEKMIRRELEKLHASSD